MNETIGIIAGAGRAPFLVAAGIERATGRRPAVAAIRGSASPRIQGVAGDFTWVGVTRMSGWIRFFRRHGVRRAVMIGSVNKRAMYGRCRVLANLPDLRTVKIWYFRLRHDKRDNAVLLAVADELAREGIELISSVEHCGEHMATTGVMTGGELPAQLAGDVEFGWRIARASADLDIGQAVAVKERDIIAVEAMEGTDAMIRRAGRLCRTGGWTLVKTARPKQDMRFDVPTVGPKTIRNLSASRCACLVVEAGKTIIADKEVTLDLARKLGVVVVGK